MTKTEGAAKRGESGFAILLVFAMAATVALMLYLELPRVAFEAQREREQTLIERGEQYKRAIQLYFRKLKTYPPSIDALENTNNVRFLRRRYVDPLTGKDDWRLIHIGPGGVFTDSLTNKQKGDKKEENHNNFITEAPGLGSAPTDQQANAVLRRRPSEGGQPQPGSDTGGATTAGLTSGADQPPVDPANPQTQTGVQPVAGQRVAGQPFAGQPFAGQNPAQVASSTSGQSMAFPTPAPPATPPVPDAGAFTPSDPTAQSGMAGNQNPVSQAGVDPSQPGANQAADLIRGLLTRPRPMPGTQPTAAAGGTQIAVGSIAGVASKVEKHGIKVYNDREMYNEWEFIYDFGKDRTGAGQLAGQMGPGDPRLTQGQSGQPGNVTGFGSQSGTSVLSGGFGSQTQQPATPGLQPGPIPPPSTPPQ
jgi:hypothetical protein